MVLLIIPRDRQQYKATPLVVSLMYCLFSLFCKTLKELPILGPFLHISVPQPVCRDTLVCCHEFSGVPGKFIRNCSQGSHVIARERQYLNFRN